MNTKRCPYCDSISFNYGCSTAKFWHSYNQPETGLDEEKT